MGEVVPFLSKSGLEIDPRILVVSDTNVGTDILIHALYYAKWRLRGTRDGAHLHLRDHRACISCTIPSEHEAAYALSLFKKNTRVKVVGIVCLMKTPPRREIEDQFPDVQLFFENPGHFRALMQYVRRAH